MSGSASYRRGVRQLAQLALDCGAAVDPAHEARLLAIADPDEHARRVDAAWAELNDAGASVRAGCQPDAAGMPGLPLQRRSSGAGSPK